MSALLAFLLCQLATPAPTPTRTPSGVPDMSRGTPVPSGGSLQDLAKRRRGFAPGDAMQGSISVLREGETGELRHEGLAARAVAGGLLVEGKVVDVRFMSGRAALEVFARRGDGRVVRGIAPFDAAAARKGGAGFSRLLSAPTYAGDPASLRPETAGGRFHEFPYLIAGTPEAKEYIKRTECLRYWGKPVPAAKDGAGDEVEVHVVNDCASPARADDTWFVIRIQADDTIEAWDRKVYSLFTEDVPPRTELTQVVPAPVPRGRRVRVVGWRLQGE